MPVQQHPIPQNVTQYQFRLIGDMTLKQFLQLAAGGILAVIAFALPIPAFFKWPLVVFFASLGAALAFLPVEGRPLSQWIIAFFKSIYSPTIYTWQKQPPQQSKQQVSDSSPSPAPAQPQTKQKTSSQSSPSLSSFQVTQKSAPKKIKTKTTKSHSLQTPPTPSPQPTPQEKQPPSPKKQPSAPQTSPSSSSPQPQKPGQQTPFSSDLPIPHPSEEPNTIVGMTLTPQGKIMEDTLVEILKNGSTVRATKSNKLGQFRFVKPLENGTYQITAENPQFTFPTYDLNLEGKILPPLKLQANQQTS